jgi:hypothetical protein
MAQGIQASLFQIIAIEQVEGIERNQPFAIRTSCGNCLLEPGVPLGEDFLALAN